IKFLDFNNKQRVQFLLNFINLQDSTLINVKKISLESIKIRPDETMSNLPKDLESMKGKVANLNLHGQELDDTIYISDDTYRSSILCEKMKFGLQYNYLNRTGLCIIEASFTGALSRNDFNDTELRISIIQHNNSFDSNFSSTRTKLLKEINRIKESGYTNFKQN
ncbi:MAG: hypothetical protein Q8909_18575, partial [Bacteroidota bacterium]|nr:hypothetical protein [Bacteroidota bacterium]